MPAVGIDVTPLASTRTGIGRYTYELLDALWGLAPAPAVVPLGNRELAGERLPARDGGAPAVSGPRVRSRAAWTFLALPRWLGREGFAAFHGTGYYAPISGSVPTVVTLHDMSVFACPEAHPPARVLRARAILGRVARHATAIIAPSAFSADEAVRWLGVPGGAIRVIPGAASRCFRQPPDEAATRAVARRYGLNPGFHLFLGTVEPRKNLARVVEAVAMLRRRGDPVRLVVAGALGWGHRPVVERVRRLGLSDAVRFVGHVPDSDLAGLLSMATAVVYPSLYEGFGLPVVEAMASGVPVITSAVGAPAEAAGGAALLVDPLSADDIAAAMRTIACDVDLRADLRRLGLRRAGELSWATSARETLAVYAGVIDSSGDRL